MEGNRCAECVYFARHYSLFDGRLVKVACGHCLYCRGRSNNPQKKACDAFERGRADSAQYVTKCYLTETLLRRVLELPLLSMDEESD